MIFLCFLFLVHAEKAAENLWWQKPEVQRKIRDERQIIVVIKEDEKLGKGYYSMTGAGLLRSTPEFTLKKILEFNELPKISPYFKKVVHQPELSRVYIVLEAYGYEARLLIKYLVKKEAEKTIFHWNVVWGGFEGMEGDIEMTSKMIYKVAKTEAILRAHFDDKEIPLPNIFKSFILEVIVQKVAQSVRGYIEGEFDRAPTLRELKIENQEGPAI